VSPRQPCASCPWRTDQDARAIPNFSLDLAERLVGTSPDARGYGPSYGAPLFACHQSREGEEIVCAGWLAAVGAAHPNVRLAVLSGSIHPNALAPGDGWPELHEDFSEVIEKLRATTPARVASNERGGRGD
jgi:hypothetical protein